MAKKKAAKPRKPAKQLDDRELLDDVVEKAKSLASFANKLLREVKQSRLNWPNWSTNVVGGVEGWNFTLGGLQRWEKEFLAAAETFRKANR